MKSEGVIVIVVVVVRMTLGDIVGYDCLQPSTNISVVGLDFVKSCHQDITDYEERNLNIQLLQQSTKSDIDVYSCLVIQSYFMIYCGMHSHNSLVSGGFGAREIMKIDKTTCRTLITDGYFRPNGHLVEGLITGAVMTRQIVDVGSFGPDGSCDGANVNIKGRWYENVARQVNFEIMLTTSTAVVDLEAGKVVTNNGYRFDYGGGKGFDPQFGYTYWTTPEEEKECSPKTYTVLYEGPATMLDSRINDVQTVIVNSSDFIFAIEVKKDIVMCQSHAFSTEHPKIYVLYGPAHKFILSKTSPKRFDVDQFLYINSKFVYIEKHFQGQIESLYKHLYGKICDLKHQQLSHLASLAYIDPEVFAWTYTGLPGISAVLGGEVVYLMQCHPRPMSYRPVSLCYLEIPVNNSGIIGFLRPRTRIFVRYGTEVPCNPLTPSMFKLGSKWVQMTPGPVQSLEPPYLSASDPDSWKYQPINHLLTSGIYSNKVLQDFSSRLLYPMEKAAIQNIIGGTTTGQQLDSQNLDFNPFVTPSMVEKIQATAAAKLWGWYNTLVTHASGFVGIFLIIRLILWLISFLLNCRALYGIFGFSFQLCGAVWSVITKHLMFHKLQEMIKNPRCEDIEMGEPNAPKAEDAQGESEITPLNQDAVTLPLYPNLPPVSPRNM